MDIPRSNRPTASDPKPSTCALCGQPLDAEKRLTLVTAIIGWALFFAAVAFWLSRIV
jgi:hypothetical protein